MVKTHSFQLDNKLIHFTFTVSTMSFFLTIWTFSHFVLEKYFVWHILTHKKATQLLLQEVGEQLSVTASTGLQCRSVTVVQPVESHYTAVLRPSAPNICAVMFLFVIRMFVRDSVKKTEEKKKKKDTLKAPPPNLRESTCERLNRYSNQQFPSHQIPQQICLRKR